MNINDFLKANASFRYGSLSSVQSPGGISSAGQAGLQKAEKRIQAQVDSTDTQLSSMGKLKSSVSDTQISALSLGSLKTGATAAEEKTALNNFVSAFNKTLDTAASTAKSNTDPLSAQSSNRVAKDLTRALSLDTATADALKKVGASLDSGGKLVLNTQKFESAQSTDAAGVRAALTRIGQKISSTASKELASDGNVGMSLSSLNQRSSLLKSQQATLASFGQFSSGSSNSNSNSYFGTLPFGSAAYQNS
jgi:hypothetical protein